MNTSQYEETDLTLKNASLEKIADKLYNFHNDTPLFCAAEVKF